MITSTVRLPKPKRKDLAEAENVANRTDVPPRKDKEEEEEDNESQQENVSDEGIDDADSDSATPLNDYLISSVSKADLELMSMQFLVFSIRNFYFISSIEKYYSDDEESFLLSVFITNGVERLKTVLTSYNPSVDDEKTKYCLIIYSF